MTDVVLRSGLPAETMIKDTIESLEADLRIITGEGATVRTNKILISQGSTILKSLLSHNISPCVLLLPDLTASAVNHFIRIITKGVTSGHGLKDKILKEVREVAQVLGFENIPELSFEAERHSLKIGGEHLHPSVIGDLNEDISLDLANMDILIKIELEENQHSLQDLHVNGQDLHIKIELEENQGEDGQDKLCLNDEDIIIPGSSNDEHNTVGLSSINISENSFITEGSLQAEQDQDEHSQYDQNSNREVTMVDTRQGHPHGQESCSPSKSSLSSSTNMDVSNQGTSFTTNTENSKRKYSMNQTNARNDVNLEHYFESAEPGEKYAHIHSLKKCSVELRKMNTEVREQASKLSKRQAKRKNICSSSQSNVVPKHTNIQKQKEGVLHKCKMCNYKTKYKSNLTKHIQAEHEGILLSCSMCNYETKYKGALTKHIQAEHEGILYSCETCNFETKYRDHLSTHIQAKHKGILHSCTTCSFKTKYKGDLKKHIQAEHEGLRYSCKTCNYETKYKGDLKKHIQAEHEGILHSCKMCNFKAKYRNNLSSHIQAEHEGLLHSCKACNYNTKCKTNLTKHIQAQHDAVLY